MQAATLSLRTVDVTRYVTPLREGGSLPALVEADDGFMYVVKFRGAGQGVKALIAELVVGEMARALGLRVPELVFCQLDEAFGRTEPDEEIQDLLRFSTGLNLALHYLSGASTFDPLVNTIEPELASLIVWLDCLTMNVDRTARNTNLLMWHKELWLIDHGAALYVHHAGPSWSEPKPRPFPQVKDHVLLPQAKELAAANALGHSRLTPERIRAILALVPAEWLAEPEVDAEEQRENYVRFLTTRLAASETFVQEAENARKALV
ncbi:aminotransferase class I and II [Hymenobacter taeanensis]|uniref:Aminotransferase class I and II n=1 Tax=Hymenobacter taeanensis TaxID=2735321 RepID=A0A6M6BH12_9BACT|nr:MULTISPECIES: HipA family kinase [Hymenobacter]QJX47339.1 aminotransferase class I and II [Hymenobacter taeanensis]UOQ79323.1 aminotransferase class I and II [Hymenobacter sp. 5414T-23]